MFKKTYLTLTMSLSLLVLSGSAQAQQTNWPASMRACPTYNPATEQPTAYGQCAVLQVWEMLTVYPPNGGYGTDEATQTTSTWCCPLADDGSSTCCDSTWLSAGCAINGVCPPQPQWVNGSLEPPQSQSITGPEPGSPAVCPLNDSYFLVYWSESDLVNSVNWTDGCFPNSISGILECQHNELPCLDICCVIPPGTTFVESGEICHGDANATHGICGPPGGQVGTGGTTSGSGPDDNHKVGGCSVLPGSHRSGWGMGVLLLTLLGLCWLRGYRECLRRID